MLLVALLKRNKGPTKVESVIRLNNRDEQLEAHGNSSASHSSLSL